MSQKFHYTDRGEDTLERLLIWWGSVVPFVHSANCTEADKPGVLHCCEGDRAKMPTETVRASVGGMSRGTNAQIEIAFQKGDQEITLEPGDYIVYREHIGFYHLPGFDYVLEFNDAEDHFPVTGRGIAFSASHWKLPEGWWEPGDLAGLTVMLQGHPVKIVGVDAFASARSPESPYRHSFALCVSDDDAEKILLAGLDD